MAISIDVYLNAHMYKNMQHGRSHMYIYSKYIYTLSLSHTCTCRLLVRYTRACVSVERGAVLMNLTESTFPSCRSSQHRLRLFRMHSSTNTRDSK